MNILKCSHSRQCVCPGRDWVLLFLPLFCAAWLWPWTASALIQVGLGNDPVSDHGWPQGALAVANLKSRVGWWEGPPFGGGQWQFLYRGETEAFLEALTNFAAMRAPALDLVIRDGPEENTFPGERTYKPFTVELAKQAHLGGVVMDSDGQPLRNVKVRASSVMAMDGRGYRQPLSRQAETDDAGRFDFTGLPAGFLQLHASASGYHFGDLFTIYDVPSTNVVLRLKGAGGMLVTVVDKQGKAISQFEGNEVLVSVEPKGGSIIGSWGGSGKVNAQGVIEFKDMPPGEYRVSSRPNPSSSSRNSPEQIVKVAPGACANVKLVYE